MKFDCHVFVCTNQKPDGKKCCGEQDGMDAVKFLREYVRKQNSSRAIRIQRAGCLDVCSQGPAMVIYPEGAFYQYKNQEDLMEIAEHHLLNGIKVPSRELAD